MTLVRLARLAWIPALLMSLALFCWATRARIHEVERISAQSEELPAAEAGSPTGYEAGRRVLIAHGNNWETYQWIMQTQQMLAEGTWRVRHASYDNAPDGRPVNNPSPYRWWLGALSWLDHTLSGRPLGLSVERATLWSDPLLLVLFLLGATFLAARHLGPLAACVLPVSAVLLYPFAGSFVPGAADDVGASLLASAAMLLCLAIGARRWLSGTGSAHRWFIASALIGALGLWLSVNQAVPVLVGVVVGALAWQTTQTGKTQPPPLPWRIWGWAGAAATSVAWLLEFAPGALSFSPERLSSVHPLYAISWLCAGEALHRLVARPLREFPREGRARAVLLALLAGMAVIPIVMLVTDAPGFLARDTFALRLSALTPDLEARNLWAWIGAEAGYGRILALFLPLLVAAAAAIARGRKDSRQRPLLCIIAAPVAIIAVFGFLELGRWSQAGALLLALSPILAAAGTQATTSRSLTAAWITVYLVALIPGAFLNTKNEKSETALRAEREARLERDIAYWLARRADARGVVALAPPRLTVSLLYHGGLRGLGTPYVENREGFATAVRLAGSTTADEAQAVVRQRSVTHILMPSWDAFLHEYARLAGAQPEASLVGVLHRWLPPRWLRPVPYLLPATAEFADDRLVVFETTELQSPGLALSRLTEYFLEMQQPGLAGKAAQALGAQHAGELSALVAKARVELARGDAAAAQTSVQAIAIELKEGTDETLAWDRRVSLCLLLAELGAVPAAKSQAQRSLDEMGEKEVLSVSERTLVRFLTLCKALQLQPADSGILEKAKSRLPVELRRRI